MGKPLTGKEEHTGPHIGFPSDRVAGFHGQYTGQGHDEHKIQRTTVDTWMDAGRAVTVCNGVGKITAKR